MALAKSRLTAQGQISVPAEVQRKLGIWPLVLLSAAVQFAAWCLVDIVWVRLGIRSVDRVLLVAPVLSVVAHTWAMRARSFGPIATAVGLGLGSTALAILLVLVVGVQLHVALGGSF